MESMIKRQIKKRENWRRRGIANQRAKIPNPGHHGYEHKSRRKKKLKTLPSIIRDTEMSKLVKPLISAFVIYLVVLPLLVSAAAEEENSSAAVNSATALKYKIIAIFSSLIVGVFGVCLPIFGLDLDGDFYTFVREFGTCVVIAAYGFYIFPDALVSLATSYVGADFELAGGIAMGATTLSMIWKPLASAFINRFHSETTKCIVLRDKEEENQNGDQIHVDNNASQGHSHGSVSVSQQDHNKKLVMILEIVVHSVIIGISLGASFNVSTMKPLIAAITLHQLFLGIDCGGCISQAKFEFKKSVMMVILFSLTTPVGIGIGLGVAEIYFQNGPITLMVSALFKVAAARILWSMAFG